MEPYESKWAAGSDDTPGFTDGKLFSLSNLSDRFDVSENDPDPRGWSIYGKNGEKIGEVSDLIIDPKAMKVRYLDVEAEDDLFDDDTSHHLLIPIGSAKLDDHQDRVMLPSLSAQDLQACEYKGGCDFTREFEVAVRNDVGGSGPGVGLPSPGTDYNDEFYESDLYDEDRFYEPRRDDDEPRRAIRRRDNE